MNSVRLSVVAACVLAMLPHVALVGAQSYPTKPIRFITSAAGGGSDLNARLISPGLSAALGQPVVVDNRPGTFAQGQITAAAAPDGHTLLLAASDLWLQPYLHEHAPFDPVKDFAPVSLLTTTPLVVAVHPAVAAKSVKDLIALAKARPGQLNYGSGNTGSSSHLGAALFRSMAGVDVVRVPYKGIASAMNALLAGEVQMMIGSASSLMAPAKAGKLRALATTGARPSALLPGVPTVAESGLPGYEFSQTLGVLAPAKTPQAVLNLLYREIVRIIEMPDLKQKLLNTGVETVGNSPQEFAAFIKADMRRLGKVIREAGIRAE